MRSYFYWLLVSFSVFSFLQIYVEGLKCHQCNGWNGDYPLKRTAISTCSNRNNQCYTTQFCVKIIDQMSPGTEYVTYKSDCFYQTTLQSSSTNLTSVEAGMCLPYEDGSTPTKRWWYCFCNDRDYCNSTNNNYPIDLKLLFAALLVSSLTFL